MDVNLGRTSRLHPVVKAVERPQSNWTDNGMMTGVEEKGVTASERSALPRTA